MPSIRIIPIPPADRGLLAPLIVPISDAFSINVEVDHENSFDPVFAYDYSRNQFNSTAIISHMLSRFHSEQEKIIAVTSADLFIPVLTYVFGEAQLDGPFAVVSSYRLDDTLYGLPPNRHLLNERLVKETIHELGHCFGLVHCSNFSCVMRSSMTVEDIDLKEPGFCLDCAAKILPVRRIMM